MANKCLAVFTAESTRRILDKGRSRAWALDPQRARKCRYFLCIQNQNGPGRDYSETSEPHGAVFLIGIISDVIPDLENPDDDRWQVCISEYALHTVLNAWKGWRNPVHYTTLEEMGITLEALAFHSISEKDPGLARVTNPHLPAETPCTQEQGTIVPLSIAQAKAALAAYYQVSQEAIEIVIRG